MKVYKGLLIGGPDNGGSVSASSPRIPVQSLTELWLDGADKPSTVVVESGSYYWNAELRNFKWHAETQSFYSKRQLQAA